MFSIDYIDGYENGRSELILHYYEFHNINWFEIE